MWRLARPEEDERIVGLSLSLYREDPSSVSVTPDQVRRTLDTFRREPWRGRAAVLEVDGAVQGMALLVSFWSNEFSGEVCQVDELYVAPPARGQGHGTSLFAALERGELWTPRPAALALGVTPGNARARRLYESLGFKAVGTNLVRSTRKT